MECISLILATYGRCDDVGRVLDSLLAQTDEDFEVIVVDQNPDDRLLPHLQRGTALGLRIVHLREAVPSLSGARNRGIAAATGQIIGFPDDDCWYEPQTLAEVRRALNAAAGVDAVAGYWVEQLAAIGSQPPLGEFSRADWSRFKGAVASSITLFFRKSAFDRWGHFDTHLGVGQWFGAGEETDLVMRFIAQGAHIVYAPNVHVHHAFTVRKFESLGARCSAMRSRGRGTGAIYAKHRMPMWVVLRGLFGRVLRPLSRGDFNGAVVGVAAAFGALEGLLRWSGSNR